jgi:hypothetical protein
MEHNYYLKYKHDPWDWWVVVSRGEPALDPDANNASVTFICGLTDSEAYRLSAVARRMLGACWEPNQSPDERERNRWVIVECQAILAQNGG